MGDRNIFRRRGGAAVAVAAVPALVAEKLEPILPSCGRPLETIEGVVSDVVVGDCGGVPALEANLQAADQSVTVVWLGRREIAGVEAGRRLVATARVGVRSGRRVMFNPHYELKY